MKLFIFVPSHNYTFGSTIVAANSQKEAQEIVNADAEYLVSNYGLEFSEVMEGVEAYGQPRIVHTTTSAE